MTTRDFEIKYKNKRNMWAHLGLGYSMKNLNNNFSPYFKVSAGLSKLMEVVLTSVIPG